MKKNNFYPILFILSIFFKLMPAQNQALIDSLQKVLLASPDTTKLKILSDLSWELKNVDKSKALEYAQQELDLAVKLNDQKAIAQGYNDVGIIYYQRGNLPEALNAYERSLAIREKLKDPTLIASSMSKIALIYHNMGNYAKALENQLKILKTYQDLGNEKYMLFTYNNIGELYNQQNDYDKAMEYWDKSLELNKKIGDKYSFGITYSNKAVVFEKQKKYALAIENLTKGAAIFLEIDDYDDYGACLNNIGQIYRSLGDTKKGLEAYQKALEMSIKYDDAHGEAKYSCNIGLVYIDLGNYTLAESYLLKGLEIAKRNHIRSVERLAYKSLTTLYIKSKDPQAFQFYQEYDVLKDSIFSEESSKQIAEMQTKYDTEKKEKENTLLIQENEIKTLELTQKEQQRNIMLGSFALILLLVGVSYNHYRLKNKNKILQERESRTIAVFQAQEEEKIRISKELHDGVGPLLSLIKLNISSLDTNSSNEKIISKTKELASESIKEVRNISHSLMPSLLVKSGLQAALTELAEQINAGKLKVQLDHTISIKLNPEAEVNIYRIIQESVNNILKHSDASNVKIKLEQQDQNLLLTIIDDGKGFDSSKLSEISGNGLNNICSRVDFMKGKITISSNPKTGTSFTIQLPLKQISNG